MKMVCNAVTTVLLVGVAMLLTTVTGDDDVTPLKSNASVLSGHEIAVTAVTREPDKLTRERETVPFRDTTRSSDVSACTLLVPVTDCFSGEFLQPLDALDCDAHA